MGSPQLNGQFPLRTDWHETVYEMRSAGKRPREIEAATGHSLSGINRVLRAFRDAGGDFPGIPGSGRKPGVTVKNLPNAIHMQHVTGTMPNGNRRRCHSQILADVSRGIECDGGVLDG